MKDVNEKKRILKLKRQKRERGELESIDRWDCFLNKWCNEVNAKINKQKRKWLKECVEVFEFNGKLFEFVNLDKFRSKKWEF